MDFVPRSCLQKVPISHIAFKTRRVVDNEINVRALNHGNEFMVSWDTLQSQIAELLYDLTNANDRRRSREIKQGAIFCDRLRSNRRRLQCVFPYDIKRSQKRFAIRDRLRSYGKHALKR